MKKDVLEKMFLGMVGPYRTVPARLACDLCVSKCLNQARACSATLPVCVPRFFLFVSLSVPAQNPVEIEVGSQKHILGLLLAYYSRSR